MQNQIIYGNYFEIEVEHREKIRQKTKKAN